MVINKLKLVILIILLFSIGVLTGGYLFHKTQPRSVISLNNCNGTCLRANDLLGLLASIGIQNAPGLVPSVVKETDKTIVIKHPFPEAKIHYVIIPKKDIKDIGSISLEDQPYLQDMFAVAAEIIKDEHLTNYKLITNGPTYQQVTYLHFHLLAY
jgi:histidine triad (HIT) family protein